MRTVSEGFLYKIVIPTGISLLAGYLIYIGAVVAQADKTATATICIVGGLLLFAIIYISKFKVVSGLGFRAETWEEKQKEAAELIEQMRELAGFFWKDNSCQFNEY